MLFREAPDTLVAISQPSHAWLSGQIIRAWGNAAFGMVAPYDDVCLAAEQHDSGWLDWERAPAFNPSTGRPHSFRELGVAAHTEIWRRGTETALAFGRYPALLVSLHGTGLYGMFDFSAASEADAAVVRDFLDGQRTIQQRLLDGLSRDRDFADFADHATIERNRGLVRSADRMSLAICTGMRDIAVSTDNLHRAIVRQVPTADGECDLVMDVVDGDLTKITVSPWPFAAAAVRVSCEGIVLPAAPFQNENEMRAALRDVRRVAVAADLRPA